MEMAWRTPAGHRAIPAAPGCPPPGPGTACCRDRDAHAVRCLGADPVPVLRSTITTRRSRGPQAPVPGPDPGGSGRSPAAPIVATGAIVPVTDHERQCRRTASELAILRHLPAVNPPSIFSAYSAGRAWAGARLDCSSRCVSAGVLVPADTGLGALSRRERRNKTAGRPALAPACARVMSRHVRKRAGMGFSCVRGLELTAPGMHAGTSGDIESHPGQAVSAPPGLPGGIREHADTSAPVSRRVPRPAPASRD
jgi:hypothetical protein